MKVVFTLLCAAMLVGCAGVKSRPAVAVPYTLMLSADQGINPDRKARAAPVEVRLFALKSADRFRSAGFYALFDDSKLALGADMLAQESMMIQPGQKLVLHRKTVPGSAALGILVAYRDIESSTWRAVVPLPLHIKHTALFFKRKSVVSIQLKSAAVEAWIGDKKPVTTLPSATPAKQVRAPKPVADKPLPQAIQGSPLPASER